MKVTVRDKYLNVRVGKPSVNADCFQFIAPGSEIVVDGKLYKGDPFNGIDTWMKDEAGNFYWSGGVSPLPLAAVSGVLDYSSTSALPAEVKNTRGANITIGILDSGCFRHAAFSNTSITGKNFTDQSESFEDTSSQSHGTFVSGIICAGAIAGNKMTGIAPGVKLIIARITAQAGISDRAALLKGLKWMLDQKPDIINCSFDFSPSADLQEFQDIFLSQDAKNIIWVGAGQDNAGLFGDTINYPAINPNFIAVGSLRTDILQENKISQLNAKIKYLVQESSFVSTDKFDLYNNGVGSSFATALVTGSLALVKSHLKGKGQSASPQDCIDFLDNNVEQLSSPFQLETSFTIFKK